MAPSVLSAPEKVPSIRGRSTEELAAVPSRPTRRECQTVAMVTSVPASNWRHAGATKPRSSSSTPTETGYAPNRLFWSISS
jgi:hypothetical protein